jgi:O-antigen/teichoic acid export membrane protein
MTPSDDAVDVQPQTSAVQLHPHAELSTGDLKERTLRGGFAKVCAQAASFVLRVGSLMVLARLLDPQDFGVVGMVTVVTGVFGLFKDAGLGMVTVQRPTITEEQLSTLFWVNLAVGVLLGLMTAAIAPLLVAFYGEPRLLAVTMVLAAGFVFNAAGVQHSALLQRQMRFTVLSAIEVGALVVSVTVAISLAIAGYQYWALVGMAIMLPAASTVSFWVSSRWIPSRPGKSAGIRSMMQFGGAVTLNSLIVYVAYNVDKVLLGRLLGAEALGIYGRAYQLINIPTENLNSAVGGVAVSALSRLQDDPRRFRGYFLKGYSLVLALTIPVTVACALFARDIIFVLLGQKWWASVEIFRLLAPTILAFALINPLAWLLFSSGRVGRSMKMALVIAPVVILGYVAGLPYGSRGVALGYSIAMTLLVLPMIAWATHESVITLRDVLSAVRAPFVSAIIALLPSAVVSILCSGWNPLPRLALGLAVLVTTYLGTLLFATGQKGFYVDLVRDLRGRRGAAVAPTTVVP